jgi:N6-L-threonylcarbamoyladenine synthase
VTVQPSAEARKKRGANKNLQLKADVSINDVAASFQEALVEALVSKTARAAKEFDVKEVFIAGGVSANQGLRQSMRKETDLPVRYPPLNLCTDNAAMIAAAAYYRYGEDIANGTVGNNYDMDVNPMWPLTYVDKE